MEVLLLMTYFAVVWVIFKIFKIPLNKWTGTTVILGAVLLIGSLITIMAYYHPASHTARSMFVTTPIVPNVRGKVIEVKVVPNTPLEKGDLLFIIDSTPFQAKVDQITSELKFAKKRLSESKALARAAAGSQFDVETYDKEVRSLQAQLDKAQFDLDSTVVKAPAEGFVTHMRLHPGVMAVPLPLAPVMTFIHTDRPIFVAGFSQVPMQTLKVGNEAEVIFPGIPGRVFKARIKTMMSALSEGQLTPSATMISANALAAEGLIPVIIEITDDMSDFYLPMGSAAVVASYSEEFHHIQLIRKILLRMESWRNYLQSH